MADSRDTVPSGTEESTAAGDQPGETTATPAPPGVAGVVSAVRSRRNLAVLVGLTGAVLVLIALGVFFGVRVLQTDTQEVRREMALQTARQFALDLTTINYQTAEQDVQQVINGSTEQFPAEFFGVNGPEFVAFVRQLQLESTGEVTSAGVERADVTSARVLVAVRATVRDSNTPEGTPFNYRWGVELVWTSDKWLVSKVELVL